MMDFKWLLLAHGVLMLTYLPEITVYGKQITSFQVTQPVGVIYVGDQVELQCEFSEFEALTDSLTIFQRYGSGDILTLATDDGRYFQAPDNVQSSGIQENSIVAVTITDIDISFAGLFTCYISNEVGNILDQEHITLDIRIPPPVCFSTPMGDNVMFNNMDEVRLSCMSDIINPVDEPGSILFWNLQSPNPRAIIPPSDFTTASDTVTTYIELTISPIYEGSMFTCLRLTDQETCSFGPLQVQSSITTDITNMPNANVTIDPASSGQRGGNIGAIVGSILCVIIFIVVVVIVIFWLVRSGKLDSFRNREKKSSTIPKETIAITHTNGSNTATVKTDNNNPGNVQHVLSPTGGEVYAVVQKNKPAPQDETRVPSMPKANVKEYPQPPSYPRPAKRRESEEEGEHYANTGIVTGLPSSPKTSISKDPSSDAVVYANAADAVPDGKRESSASSHRMSGTDDNVVYANASEAIAGGAPLSPAPSSPTHAPPGSPGLEYADLDLVRPASVGATQNGIISNDDPVMYASVQQ